MLSIEKVSWEHGDEDDDILETAMNPASQFTLLCAPLTLNLDSPCRQL